jgi:hypothetical protein
VKGKQGWNVEEEKLNRGKGRWGERRVRDSGIVKSVSGLPIRRKIPAGIQRTRESD